MDDICKKCGQEGCDGSCGPCPNCGDVDCPGCGDEENSKENWENDEENF